MTLTPKVVVLCHNSEGDVEFFKCTPRATEDDIAAGRHYLFAKERAAEHGYSPIEAFDQQDPAARQLEALIAWLA
jgi:hypothetical protein